MQSSFLSLSNTNSLSLVEIFGLFKLTEGVVYLNIVVFLFYSVRLSTHICSDRRNNFNETVPSTGLGNSFCLYPSHFI